MLERMKSFFAYLSGEEGSEMRRLTNVIFSVLAFIGVITLLFLPICEVEIYGEIEKITAFGWLKNVGNNKYLQAYKTIQMVSFLLVLSLSAFSLFLSLKGFLSLRNEKKTEKIASKSLIFSIVFIIIYTVFTWVFSPINVSMGGDSNSRLNLGSLIYIIIVSITYAIYNGILVKHKEEEIENKYLEEEEKETVETKKKALLLQKIIMLIFVGVSGILGLLCLLTRIITVVYKALPLNKTTEFIIKGWDLLFKPEEVQAGAQSILAYVIFVLLLFIILAIFLSFVSFLSKSKFFNSIALTSVILSFSITLLVGLYAYYFKIAQGMNLEYIAYIFGLPNISNIVEFEVNSPSLIYFIGATVVLVLLFVVHPYSNSKGLEAEIEALTLSKIPQTINIKSSKGGTGLGGNGGGGFNGNVSVNDACPAFTEIDEMGAKLSYDLQMKRRALFENLSLPALVDFVVQYARDSRLHLYYTHEDIATFVAGLGTTKLSILQGMSGTGKTSLPKIFAEALYSVCDIVEVESSWRDKNELLGYYNEFNKIFTPKKFTQALYKAKLNSEVLTFIVLDEMNLSRIEYYFSDFLSLMENEPNKREIKLVNVKLFNENGEYKGLTDGHTLKIPNNVWFIGTANRDESTYDISDKVYDRAYTMNFDKRASKAQAFGTPLNPRFLPANELNRLFEEAKERRSFNLDQYPVIAQVEKLLASYNISFGNRIALQIENFVKIYASCFNNYEAAIYEGLETILLSKVVRKLELKSVDDKDSLAEEFASLNLMKCSKFIMSLKED